MQRNDYVDQAALISMINDDENVGVQAVTDIIRMWATDFIIFVTNQSLFCQHLCHVTVSSKKILISH